MTRTQPWRYRHVTVAQPVVTGTSPLTTWVTSGYTGMNRGSTVLHRKCSVVNRESTGVLLSRGPGLHRGNVGKMRTQFIFMKCVPVHHGIPAVLHRDEPWLHRHSENGARRFESS